jgi:rhodanese-related sulfurtransferase
MENKQLSVDVKKQRTWLEAAKEVVVLDVRPKAQREEWQIPGKENSLVLGS